MDKDDNYYLAQAKKYSPDLTWLFAELRPGLFALYSPIRREPTLITEDWNEVLQAYRDREPFVPYVRPKKKPSGIDPAGLEFKL